MKIRNKWVKSDGENLNYVSVDETIGSVKANFDIRRLHSAEGEDVLIDDIPVKILIQSHTNPINENREDKKVHVPNDININRGSLVYWNEHGEYWLVASKVDNLKAYKSAQIYRCNNTLTYQDPTTLEIKAIPCVLTDKSSIYSDGLKTGVITLQDDQIAIKVPFHEDIVNFPLQKRFVFDNAVVFELTDVDRLTQKGLLILTMKATQKSETNDRLDLNIADFVEHSAEPEPPVPAEIVISGDLSIKLNQTNTYTVDSESSILFWLKSDDGNDTNFAAITEQSNNTCKVKANSSSSNVGKYFRLYVGDGTNEKYIRILVKSLF